MPPAVTGHRLKRSPQLDIKYKGDLTTCIPPVFNPIDPVTHVIAETVCGPLVHGKILTEAKIGVRDVAVTATPSTCSAASCTGMCSASTATTTDNGTYGYCNLCPTCNRFKMTPSRNTNWLNGVSTYDLVLITRYLLGLDTVTLPASPYKLIAADASNTNGITTFDVVELRKLILGIYTALPNNTSWRFIQSDYVFPNPKNPFSTSFTAYESFECVDPTSTTSLDFVGIKIGDVNANAMARPTARPVTTISLQSVPARDRRTITVPVTYTGQGPLQALQLGIHFDPAKLAFVGSAKGELSGYTPDNFNLAQAGEGKVRTLWFPTTGMQQIAPNSVLFYLTFNVLDNNSGPASLDLDDDVLYNAAWQADGKEYALLANTAVQERSSREAASSLQVTVQPNPTAGSAVFNIQSGKAMSGHLALFGAYGNLVFAQDVSIAAGKQQIGLPEIARLPAGIYLWKVSADGLQAQGRLVKQ